MHELKKGNLLIAEPYLGDPNFERSVVMLCEHNAEGSFGLVLNHKSNLSLNDAVDEIYFDAPLYIGGPVEYNTLHFIHRLGDRIPDAVSLKNGLYWSGDFEVLKSMLNSGLVQSNDIRFFVGYSGWGKGQLEGEMKSNSWIITPTDSEMIFDSDPEVFWRKVLRNMGGEYKVKSNYPVDPRLN
ncbi:YqgE/AlgH family protein [Marinilongibacter aquaticus]|uniref:YqgE/AlgH family protein n=1 Tax=Marinilongibacter aquaticus TaxID=2975157 RepID=UPI0021BDA77D|nr:YqgE/AlgH family protein [Marinilongibacter aquaticus]UBM57431.1 YqgE/AlgH family protein [Marinilongibacter aquaticus]